MITVRFRCPVCNAFRTALIDNADRLGVVSAIVYASKDCPHTFIVFADEKGKARRIQRIDHLIEANLVGEYLPRGMSMKGAWTVFKAALIDIIACLLVRHTVVLCDDIDVAITLYNSLVRLWHDPPVIGKDIIIMDNCDEAPTGSLVVNCKYSVVVKGIIHMDAHPTIKRFIGEAISVNDNEAAIVFMKQKLSALRKVASLLETELKKRTTAREVLRLITSKTGLRFKYDDLHAVLMLLRSKGMTSTAKYIVMGDLDDF